MIAVAPLKLTAASDDELLGLAAVEASSARAAGLPPELIPPPGALLRWCRHAPSFVHRRAWVAEHRGSIVGYALCTGRDVPDNRHHAEGEVTVHPEARGRGIGRRLPAEVGAGARGLGCTLLDVRAPREGPGSAFPESSGFVCRLNAASNAAMLAINHAMGFRPLEYRGWWQAPVATVEAARERRWRGRRVIGMAPSVEGVGAGGSSDGVPTARVKRPRGVRDKPRLLAHLRGGRGP